MIPVLFFAIFIVSVLWAIWSLRDLKTPKGHVPKFEKKVLKILKGIIYPSSGSSS